MKYEVGSATYIVENNHTVGEATIFDREEEFYIVWLENGKDGI